MRVLPWKATAVAVAAGGGFPVCVGPDGLPVAEILLEGDEGARAIAVDDDDVVISTHSEGATFWDVHRLRKTDRMPQGFYPQLRNGPWSLGLDEGEVFESKVGRAVSDGSDLYIVPSGIEADGRPFRLYRVPVAN